MAARSSPVPARVEVLGPLRLLVDGVAVEVTGPKRRAVLALLALAEGRMVTVDHLLEALWPAEVPESGRQALHSHVSRLRRHLGAAAERLQTRQDGYRLELADGGLDVTQARALLASGRTEVKRDPAAAHALLQQAYQLWRGPVLADLTDVAPIAAAVEACAQLHREVTDALVASAIAAGQAETIVGLAAESAAADPLREPAVMLVMRALAATGQAPEALRTGTAYRSRLADETGLDPSPALDDLARDIASGAIGPPGTPSDAPALLPAARQPPARPRVHLPEAPADRSVTRLVGRAAQVAALHRLLGSERLVSVVGPGGVGKTSVALEVARLTEQATVLLLARVSDPAAIPHVLAEALNLNVGHGDVLAACLSVLRERPGLMVIDNCEHLLDGVRDLLNVVMSACPDLSVLATSREPLGLGTEYAFRLAPLPLPGADQDLAQAPAVAVFVNRARRVSPHPLSTPADLLTVADIVRRLDGIPLAIELAAGRLSTFSLSDLQARLDRSLDLLGGGRPSGDKRHRTLRDTIEWSYQLLTNEEQRLFRHLSVFVDGVDLDTAERLATDLHLKGDPGSILARLVDASMIIADFTVGTRYRMLHTLRAFARDRLTAAAEDEAAARHLVRWAVELVGWVAATMATEREPEADAALRRELPNLRAAWRLARSRESLDDAVAIVAVLFNAVAYRDLVEIRGWAEELADVPQLAAHPRAAEVLATAAEAVYHRGDYLRADRLARAGLAKAIDDVGSWHCLLTLSIADLARGAYADAVEHSLAAAGLAVGPRESPGIAALAMAYSGDPDRARPVAEQLLAGAESPTMRSWATYVVGEVENCAGRSELAEQHYLRAVELARTSGATFIVGVATVGLLSVRAAAGRVHEALAGYRDVIDYFARNGNWTHLWTTLRNLADLLRRLGDDEPAAVLDAAADQAPDAPANERTRDALTAGRGPDVRAPVSGPVTPIPSRAAILELAQRAIQRNLPRS